MTSGTPPGTGTTLFACTTAAMACSTAPKRISASAALASVACGPSVSKRVIIASRAETVRPASSMPT